MSPLEGRLMTCIFGMEVVMEQCTYRDRETQAN